MVKRRILLSDKRDLPLLVYLWRWKLLTTAALAEKFFKDYKTIEAAYNRILRLEKAGFVSSCTDQKCQNSYWTLTLKGLRAIEVSLPSLYEDGYKSENISHDALVTALHLGDWLTGAPDGVRLFSEQQLRRYTFDTYPEWVPQAKRHRPDGYWGILKGGEILPVALEVELSRKKKSEYQKVANFYGDHGTIVRVLWLVPSKSVALKLKSSMDKSIVPRPDLHNFILVKDFEEQCWQTPIVVGPDKNKTVLQFLNDLSANHGRKPVETRWRSTIHPLLDTQKSYTKSQRCQIGQIS